MCGAGPAGVVTEGMALPRAHPHAAHQCFIRRAGEKLTDRLRWYCPFPAEQPHLGIAGQCIQAVHQLAQWRLQRHGNGGSAYLAADHPRAAAALAHQQAVVGQHLQGLSHRHPGNAQAPCKFLFARQLFAVADLATLDQRAQESLQLVIQRRVQVAAEDALQRLGGERIHGGGGACLGIILMIYLYNYIWPPPQTPMALSSGGRLVSLFVRTLLSWHA
ncbi:hypothetical protein D3C81_934520 [compost metagenome]